MVVSHGLLLWYMLTHPDSNVHGVSMGPIWGRQDPGGPHVGPMNLAIWAAIKSLWPHGVRYFEYGFRYWPAPWQHQAITWTNVDMPSVNSSCIHYRVSFTLILKCIGFKFAYINLQSYLPRGNELTYRPETIKSGSSYGHHFIAVSLRIETGVNMW